MPLDDLGSLIINPVVFLTHLVYLQLTFTHVDASDLLPLYCAFCLLARRADDIVDDRSSLWPPRALGW
ncbi:hypothetical protein ACRE_076780 [Hapsidospora chrysogenum ATCC 11550]|uniref:Uncharacterized protein n=1 Tax=Hapsidospora chrysogenum (strain ATCC 11550 / CBS 779.69 / DSM 880 / IAM 14645 / JCM 23072 / IMI 49137) TaxID=857340 RepID=A0A086SWY6_HAPC1|nr:hypothetical protein ACRE_076780 [Hapsidospora chrysogenum ATCC 11550]